MKRTMAITVAAGALLMGTVAGPAAASEQADLGCTPGYWKQSQHFDSWEEARPNRLLTQGDSENRSFTPTGDRVDDTFLMALGYKGGPGADGAERILLRAAVAAWLNAANETTGYPIRRAAFIPEVNAAIQSGDRARMLELATYLDGLNNLGCPLS